MTRTFVFQSLAFIQTKRSLIIIFWLVEITESSVQVCIQQSLIESDIWVSELHSVNKYDTLDHLTESALQKYVRDACSTLINVSLKSVVDVILKLYVALLRIEYIDILQHVNSLLEDINADFITSGLNVLCSDSLLVNSQNLSDRTINAKNSGADAHH